MFSFYCRLCITYNYESGNVTKLDTVISESTKFFKENSLLIPSKDIICRLIPYLFGCEPCSIYEHGKRYSAYKNLGRRQNTETSDNNLENINIEVPSNCVMSGSYINEFQLKVILLSALNGQQEFYSVSISKIHDVSLIFRNLTVKLGFRINLSQQSIDGLLHLVMMVKLCKGIEAIPGESSALHVKELSHLNPDKFSESRVWSPSCKVILNWSSKKDCCDTCLNSIKKSRKRKLSTLKEANDTHTIEAGPNIIESNETDTNEIVKPEHEKENIKEDGKVQLNENDHESMETILNSIIEHGAPEKFKLLLQSQLHNCRKGLEVHQRRWDHEVLSVCLGLYLRSPRAYEDLKKSNLLVLPSQRLLQYYKNSVKQSTGFNEDNLNWMKEEARRQNVPDFGLHGGLIIDEMSIQDDLVIRRKGDTWELIGDVDLGRLNNNIDIIANGEKKVKLSTHVLQLVFHGLTGFRWPVAYFGTCTAAAHQLYNVFWQCIDILDDKGFTIDYVMADGASTNRSFSSMLFNCSQRESLYMFKDVYNISHSICYIQDIMHVLKRVRNNVESSSLENKTGSGRYLVLNECCILWDHWVECSTFNVQNGLGIHKKLTEEHFSLTPASKMRNQLAIDVLNKNMLFLMKSYQGTLHNPERLQSSIDLLKHTSMLTEIFCNTNQPIYSLSDKRIDDLRVSLKFFNDWEKQVMDSVLFNERKNLMTSETREDINSSILGFLSLCELKLGDGNSINPGFVNSDIVENLFGQQRGIRNGLNTNPTLAQYGPSNTAIILGQCSVSNKCNSGKSTSCFNATSSRPLNMARNKCNVKKRRSMRV